VEHQPQEHNPWDNVEERYQLAQQVQGVVTRITHFGVFIQLEPGLEGIIYTFELGSGPSAVAGFVPGQEMQLYVNSVDAGRKRLELSLEQPRMLGLLKEHPLPATMRRSQPAGELPPLPEAFVKLPLAPPQALFEQNEHNCPTCQRAIQAAWKYCIYCGHTLRIHCSACGSTQPNLPDARYCYECGNTLI
jgi:double zinc ribbon protein/S1 RNA binding family protein